MILEQRRVFIALLSRRTRRFGDRRELGSRATFTHTGKNVDATLVGVRWVGENLHGKRLGGDTGCQFLNQELGDGCRILTKRQRPSETLIQTMNQGQFLETRCQCRSELIDF